MLTSGKFDYYINNTLKEFLSRRQFPGNSLQHIVNQAINSKINNI